MLSEMLRRDALYARAKFPRAAGVVHRIQSGPIANMRLSQVYSFVPIPGAQQHKRPRRRYEEIERMYKCGWNGCEKAYGTLNHLNAHVTMQSHGQKRTPEGMLAVVHICSDFSLPLPHPKLLPFSNVRKFEFASSSVAQSWYQSLSARTT